MAISPGEWVSPDDFGWVLHPADDAGWQRLIDDYGGRFSEPLRQIVRVVRAQRCQTVVVENRYVDLDWRSEYAGFWSGRFESPPPFARRLHFFRRKLAVDQIHQLPDDPGYLGYSVIRPVVWGSVGRTVLSAPLRFRDAVLTSVTDQVSFFGTPLTVRGVPFYQQDTEYLRCAHAAAWIVHYTGYRRGLAGRRPTAAVFGLSPKHLSPLRSVPSGGLSPWQLQAVFEGLDQPAIVYDVGRLPDVPGAQPPTPKIDAQGRTLPHGYWDPRLFSVICRYLNSGFPVVVAGDGHAWTLVGYRQRGTRIEFVACDDQRGPYELIPNPYKHYRAPWHTIMVPVPPKVYVAGEAAEVAAYRQLRGYAAAKLHPDLTRLGGRLKDGEVRLRCFLLSGSEYKRRVSGQGRSLAVQRLIRLARLPHWVWVVEAQDRAAHAAGRPSVLAEIAVDTTSHDLNPRICAMTLPGGALAQPPEQGRVDAAAHTDAGWRSLADFAG